MTKLTSLLITALLLCDHLYAQPGATAQPPTRQDSLRGSNTAERSWWNITKYDITVQPDFNTKTIKGSNNITFTTTADGNMMQIDLQEPMQIIRVSMDSKDRKFTRNGNVYYVEFDEAITRGNTKTITIQFGGKPSEAVTPPWDGGWIW